MKPLYVTCFALIAAAIGACKSESASRDTSTSAAASASASAKRRANAIPAPPDVAAPPANAQKTSSGLASLVIQPGTGTEHPAATDKVKVHYTGWNQSNGEMFDSSVNKGRPAEFRLDQVIKGWTEGVQLMVAGEKRRFWIPAALAYGDKAKRPGGPSGDLCFDVELLEIIPTPKPPPAPADVAAAPKTAKKTASGLQYVQLKKGNGKDSPKPTDMVEIIYTGWTPDGKLAESSIPNGRAAKFRLDRVMKGWTEGLQLMKAGDQMRFWIPADLAHGDKPSRADQPQGPLVYDIELVSFSEAPIGHGRMPRPGASGSAAGSAGPPPGRPAPAASQ
ncbi:MAG TPA: FKBP-type peptidyl-prolyl cis-trans isomerase [Polyangiaceae bacterium]|nr:FKBP-type peptidyl-prolyl cis-trans isomerase [Polyangiaceae bacterium]